MILDVKFDELEQDFTSDFGEVVTASDGGYEKGYEAGLAERTYEIWTITLADGSAVEKKVALL